MSTDICLGGFSLSERGKFLDAQLTHALEQNEFKTLVHLVGIKNFEQCPFCPFAAECPPIEEDTELRCCRDGCSVISCRLCKQKTHLPKTCEEMQGGGLSNQRYIDEAMSAALIRRCNECRTPFIKEAGCNMMKCAVCGNTQCYVCSTSCSNGYRHFDGKCPLIDDHEKRHQREITEAKDRTRKRLRAGGYSGFIGQEGKKAKETTKNGDPVRRVWPDAVPWGMFGGQKPS
jgi:TRIAD3 protein (E3 ubiquitin-protein ligase RNF216)